MAKNNPRVHTVLEPPVYAIVERLAETEGVSMSQKVRDLVVDALELLEDIGLEAIAGRRLGGSARVRWISQDEVERRLGLK